jgi:hypothetical protein
MSLLPEQMDLMCQGHDGDCRFLDHAPCTCGFSDYRREMSKYAHETAVLSFTAWKHPSCIALRGMGKRIVPFLFRDLETIYASSHPHQLYIGRICTHLLFILLSEFTEANPVAERDRGRVPAIAKAWLKWGRDNGYLTADAEPKTQPEPKSPNYWVRRGIFMVGGTIIFYGLIWLYLRLRGY